MQRSYRPAALALIALIAIGTAQEAKADYCGSGNTVIFADLTWENGAFLTEVLKAIISKGYGCRVDAIPGNTVTLEQALANDDVQIFADEWPGRTDVWKKAAAQGKVKAVGHPYDGGTEGWYVPAFVIKGDPVRGIRARAPDLTSVTQLSDPKYVALFRDPEEPARGRFLNCPAGWSCEVVNNAKLDAYGLSKYYVNFHPGTPAALDSAISSAYLQGEPLLFYYWSPTAVTAKYDLVQLSEPPYSDKCWHDLFDRAAKLRTGCASGPIQAIYGTSSRFFSEAPDIIALLQKAQFPISTINSSLRAMVIGKMTAKQTARDFLVNHRSIWEPWMPPAIASNLLNRLDRN
jgi:glycine betaine/proline transport system substrate-binding protein